MTFFDASLSDTPGYREYTYQFGIYPFCKNVRQVGFVDSVYKYGDRFYVLYCGVANALRRA